MGLLCASAATAQTPASTAPASRGQDTELSLGLSFLPPVPMGSAGVNFVNSTGLPFMLANTTNRTGPSFGIEARIGFRMRQRLAFEMAGAWSHVSFQTSVANDVEAAAVTASRGVSRFGVGGAAVFKVRAGGPREIYTLVGASWMREIGQISSGALYADGAIVDGGLGVKMWFRDRGKGRVKRVGLRIEGRAGLRAGGLKLDTKSVHFVSGFVGSLIIGS